MDTYARIQMAAALTAPSPTPAQAAAQNYKKGRVDIHGLKIAIENARGSERKGVGADGVAWSNLMQNHYGHFVGFIGSDGDGVDVFIGAFPESDTAWIVNQVNANGSFDEHKVMLGFVSEEQARNAYLGSYGVSWKGLGDIVECTIEQLKHWLENANKLFPATTTELHSGESMNKAFDSAAELGKLVYGIRRSDADSLALTPITVADILAAADGEMALDALVIEFAKVERKMGQMEAVMNAAGNALSVAGSQVTPPFKQRGTTNVASVFELSDGQTISVFFHNPDVTPNRIAPQDELVSWKWLLNKKDITILVAPEKGDDLNVREVSRRIMKVAEKNSARFAKANADRAAKMADVARMESEIASKEGILSGLQAEIIDLEARRAAKKQAADKSYSDSVIKNYKDQDAYIRAKENGGIDPKTGATAEELKSKIDEQSAELEAKNNAAIAAADKKGGKWWDASTYDAVYLIGKSRGNDYVVARKSASGFDVQMTVAGVGGATTGDVSAIKSWLKSRLQGMGSAMSGNEMTDSELAAKLKLVKGEDVLGIAAKEQQPIELTGKELGDFPDTPEGLNKLRAAAMKQYSALKTVPCPALGSDVEIRKSGAKKISSLSGDPRKLKSLAALKQIIGTAKEFKPKSGSYAPKAEPSVKAYHYLRSEIVLAGEPLVARIVIKEDVGGKFHWDQTIHSMETVLDGVQKEKRDAFAPLSVTNYKSEGVATPTRLAGDRPYLSPQDPEGQSNDAMLDGVGQDDDRLVLNLFFEGEEPEVVTEEDADEYIEVPTVDGEVVRVAKIQLAEQDRMLLNTFTKEGEKKIGRMIHRGNILLGDESDPELSPAAALEKEMRDSGQWKVARFPRSAEQRTKLRNQGYAPYLKSSNGEIVESSSLGLVWAAMLSTQQPLNATADARDKDGYSADADGQKLKAMVNLKKLSPFLSGAQRKVLSRNAQGEEGEFFVGLINDLYDRIANMPVTYGQDGLGDQAIVYLHYFSGSIDSYITEKDKEGEGTEQAFGYQDLGYGGELGYISIAELVSNNMELDLYWKPKTLGAVKNGGDDSAAVVADNKESPLDAFEKAGGEPWQVTQDKWVEIMSGHMVSLGQKPDPEEYEDFHRAQVKKALDDGRVVPEEVLADYPDLKAESPEEKAQRYAKAEQNLNNLIGAAAGEAPQTSDLVQNPELEESKRYLQSVIDGSADMLDAEMPERFNAWYEKFSGNAEFDDLMNRAVEAYTNFALGESDKAMK